MLSLETFKQYWDRQFPDLRLRRDQYVIAVSGGVDSVVLAHLMFLTKSKCSIAHVNFNLRGEESKRDEAFVRALALKYNFDLHVHSVDTTKYAQTYKMGIQEAAREIRYAWFETLLGQGQILLTAHHADDQVETILMQLFRGTGLHGLTGMPNRRKDILNLARPLLSFTKEAITDFAYKEGIDFVEDSSNAKDDYTRNLIRNTLLPQIQDLYPSVKTNIFLTGERMLEAEKIVEKTITDFWKKGVIYKKGIKSIPISYWQKVKDNATYTWSLIKQYGFKAAQINEVHKLLDADNGAYIASNSYRFIKYQDNIQIVPLTTTKEHTMVYAVEGNLNIQAGVLHFELIEASKVITINPDPKIAYLNADLLSWPLLVRTWQPTDYFYPLGLRKKKKLNHFLGNLKLSPAIKEKVAVLACGDKILWVIGHRIDDRFKFTEHTKQVLKITFS
jgi:tRNA(Ile)-lysidine synthase